ncbi:RTC4-like domain-containing protein [Pochonia chlamydosporia 170]|uniref:Restriction of telomere capping protein 4 n=1 Tax=Pochonia chlamydosporia 170 TaxID=1380566 RepID=A0A179FCN3_METCM|nr:RTC4-like domain-containing protein [Pochonia chlamydosporia 170]OAQ63335.1 RTC4-like domain-containing protein [Pochonia chlamydosporia 170]
MGGLLNNEPKLRMAQRRIGLNRNQNTPSLLSRHKPPYKIKVPETIDAPPVSSSDEDDDSDAGFVSPIKPIAQHKSPSKSPQKLNMKKLCSLIDSSESSGEGDERAARAGIKSTNFGTTKGTMTTRETRSKRKDSPVERTENAKDADSKRRRMGETAQRTQRKTSRSTPPASSGEHLRDELGFTKIRRAKATYGKKENSSQEVPVKKGLTDTQLTPSDTNAEVALKKDSATLRVPAVLQSPERTKKNKLLLPSDLPPSSPEDKPKLKLSSSFGSSQSSPGGRREKKLRKFKAVERSPSPPPAVFKMPASISDLQLRKSKNDAIEDSLIDDQTDVQSQTDQVVKSNVDDDGESAEAAATCPWCGEPVDKMLLDDFAKGRRLNVRLQSKFCQKHKKQTATELWEQKSYPEVQWGGLEKRFTMHHELLLNIINGGDSHFRCIHKKNISSGKARSMKKEGNMNPGYYGPRGFNLMCDYLVNEFSDLLKKKAVDDRVISGRGSAAFIQTVLVAELAVRLIMDDMNVTEEEARDILEESKALGEMIHEET